MSTLPPLPEPFVAEGGDKHVYWPDQYVAEQMRDYALAATAPLEARIAELEKERDTLRASVQTLGAELFAFQERFGIDTAMKDHP